MTWQFAHQLPKAENLSSNLKIKFFSKERICSLRILSKSEELTIKLVT